MNKKQEEQFDKKFPELFKSKTDHHKFCYLLERQEFEVKQFISTILKTQRKKTKEMIKEFEYTLYPYQVKRSKEWLAGYDYCKKGITESTKSIIKRLK